MRTSDWVGCTYLAVAVVCLMVSVGVGAAKGDVISGVFSGVMIGLAWPLIIICSPAVLIGWWVKS